MAVIETLQKKLGSGGMEKWRDNGYIITHSSLDIPPQVRDAILAAPGAHGSSDYILGDLHTDVYIWRSSWLQFTGNLIFDLGKNGQPFPPFIVLAAKHLIIPGWAPTHSDPIRVGGRITYEFFGDLNAPDKGPGANGADYASSKTGQDGGAGGDGPPGDVGKTVQLPPLFILFQEIKIDADVPDGNIRAIYDGVDGGRGGRGGLGGNGGHGAEGTPAKCLTLPIEPHCVCETQPGRGGNGGNAGRGGKGGKGGKGGDGGSVTIAGPGITAAARIFEVSTQAGWPGYPGDSGTVGSVGLHGNAGARCSCSDAGEAGKDGILPVPTKLGAGDRGDFGVNGLALIFERNNDDLF